MRHKLSNPKLSLLSKLVFFFMLVCAPVDLGARAMRTDHIFQHQLIFAQNVAKLIEYIYAQGYKCTLGEVYRTREQALLYSQIGKGIVNSNHCSKLAIDINLFKDDKYLTDSEEYKKFAEYWIRLNPFNESGYFWKSRDSGHFEMD